MRLYPRREGTEAVDHAGVRYTAQPDGGFDLPHELTEQLHSVHDRGERLWEDAIERQRRLITEEAARRADPATLLAAVEQLVKQAEADALEQKPAARTRAAKAAA